MAFSLKMRMQQQGDFPLFAVSVDTEVFGDASRQPLSMLRRGDVLSDGPQPEHGVLRHVFGSHAVGATAPADVQGCSGTSEVNSFSVMCALFACSDV